MDTKPPEKPIPPVEGFNLSQDYELLWRLICNGYRVPGWVKYTDRYMQKLSNYIHYDIVEVSKRDQKDTRYIIGTRGIGYNSYCGADDQTPEKSFMEDCTHFNLWFAVPNYKIPLLPKE